MRIAFFGGTFDPPHIGHRELAGHILDGGITDLALFVPAFSPPHKIGKQITPFEHRLKMLELAVGDMRGVKISDIERRTARIPSYTIETMKDLQREFPDDHLQLLIGSDSLVQLHSWYQARELVDKWEIITYPRRNELPSRDDLLTFWTPEETDILLKSVLKMPFFEISSTLTRKIMANAENTDNLINRNVKDYINAHGLYREQETE